MNERCLRSAMFCLVLGVFGGARGASAQTSDVRPGRALTEGAAIALALEQNPNLQRTLLAIAQAEEQVRGEEGAFPWQLQVDGGYTHMESPSLGPGGSVVTSTNDTLSAGSQLEKSFPTGTGVQFRVQGDRFDTRRPTSSLAGGDTSVSRGFGYEMSARATVTQPLLQGRGARANLADLRAARISRSVAERAGDGAVSQLARDVSMAFWEAWYATRAVQIERAARDLAQQELDAARARRVEGALAPADVWTFETRVAELEESVVAAEADERQRLLSLQQLLGGVSVGSVRAEAPEAISLPEEGSLLERVEVSSPELAELRERLRLSQSRAEVAEEPYRARLDLESYVEARGLGNERLSPAWEQVGRLDAISVHAGVLYRTPLDARQRSSARARAALDVQMAERDIESARQNLRAQVQTLLSNAESAAASLEAARSTAHIAERQHGAERERFRLGASTPIAVQQAEDSLRRARHRVLRALVNLREAQVDLEHYTGALLARYAGGA